MQRPLRYYIFRQSHGGNVRLPKQAHVLLELIRANDCIEKKKLVRCMAFSNALKSDQPMSRILTYYGGLLVSRRCIDIIITMHKPDFQCIHCGYTYNE